MIGSFSVRNAEKLHTEELPQANQTLPWAIMLGKVPSNGSF